MKTGTKLELEGFRYRLVDASDIEAHVLEVCEPEWDPDDFEKFGGDLYNQN